VLQVVTNALVLSSVYLLFALGLSIAWGTIGIVNFAHGSIFMFSAFAGYLVLGELQLPMVVLLLLGAAAGALLSVLGYVLIFEPILRRARNHTAGELQLLIGGLGFAGILLALAQHKTRSTPFGFSRSSFELQTFTVAGVQVTNVQIVIVLLGVGLTSILAVWLRKSRIGLALRAIGQDADTARMMGANQHSLAVLTVAISGALAGISGVMLTFAYTSINPDTGDHLLLKGFAIVVFGGVGSLLGGVIGAVVLASAETIVLMNTTGMWVDAISFGLIMVILLVRPSGLLARPEVRRT